MVQTYSVFNLSKKRKEISIEILTFDFHCTETNKFFYSLTRNLYEKGLLVVVFIVRLFTAGAFSKA
jgi:hypothetical protein